MSERFAALKEYVPGEQPKDKKYIKLNTNESPYPPSPSVEKATAEASRGLYLYSDPECRILREKTAEVLGVRAEQVVMTNGSDEILNFAFMAFGDKDRPFAFPEVSYGFYKVFAELYGIPYRAIPLAPDLSINAEDYIGIGVNIVIANPNAPTGLALSLSDVERIVASNPDHVVVIDEAYVDFGGESAIGLIDKYENLLVTRTFSKSGSLAGARLGIGIANEKLLADINKIRYSTNPYNVNSMTAAAGVAAIADKDYYRENCRRIVETREKTKKALAALGFSFTDSQTNFIFAVHPALDGEGLYLRLKEMGILVRHIKGPNINEYNRITVGTPEQMKTLLSALENMLKEGDAQ